MNKLYFILILIAASFYSCLDKEDFSEIPEITYEEYSIEGTSIVIKISFTDGDGDIGFRDGQEQYPFGPCDEYHYNLLIDPYFMQDGQM